MPCWATKLGLSKIGKARAYVILKIYPIPRCNLVQPMEILIPVHQFFRMEKSPENEIYVLLGDVDLVITHIITFTTATKIIYNYIKRDLGLTLISTDPPFLHIAAIFF